LDRLNHSPLSPTIKLLPQPQHITAEWAIAERETLEGIHYAMWKYPQEDSIRPTTFAREPVDLEEGDRMFILDRLEEKKACRVRVLRTGAVGLIPQYLVEAPLDRLTRINTDLNEIKTCPAERKRLGKPMSDDEHESATHQHDHNRCVVEPRDRIRRRLIKDEADVSDSEFPLTPTSPRFPEKLPRRVGFAESGKKKIYRYVPPAVVVVDDGPVRQDASVPEAMPETAPIKEVEDEPMDVDDEEDNGDEQNCGVEDDGDWWWSGWEEEQELPPPENLSSFFDDGDDDDDRVGRPRFRRHTFSVDSSSTVSPFTIVYQPTSFQI